MDSDFWIARVNLWYPAVVGAVNSSQESLSISDLDLYNLIWLGKVNTFTKTGGFIDSSKQIIESNLLFLRNSLNRVEDQLAAKEQRYRNEFARLQEMMASLNDQMSSLRMFSQGF